jgi:DNA repair ATPase RecN
MIVMVIDYRFRRHPAYVRRLLERPFTLTDLFKPEESSLQALVIAMRQVSENTSRIDRSMEALNNKMGEVRDRLTHIEAQGYDKKISDLKETIVGMQEQIDSLEQDKDQRDGVTNGLEWLSKVGGWITAAALGVFTLWAFIAKK